MDDLLRDIRGALRRQARQPLFTGVAVLTLAIGIGANTAIFSVLHAVLLRPLPFHEPAELVWARQQAPEHGTRFEFSYLDYRDLRESAASFTALAAVANVRRFVHDAADAAAPVHGGMVTPDLFDVLGVQPLLGRWLSRDDASPGAERVVVLSHGLWQRSFGADASVLGAPMRLDAQDYTIVGVMPPGFEYPHRAELWIAVELAAAPWIEQRQVGFLDLVGRLAPGVTIHQARAELDALLEALPGREDWADAPARSVVLPLRDVLVGTGRPALLLIFAGAGLLLLVACANIASMLLAQGVVRGQEIAVRSALGAGRARLVRQLLAESLVLAGIGAGMGVALAYAGIEPLVRLSPVELYRGDSIAIVPEVLGFTALLTLLTAAAFGAVPALRGTRHAAGPLTAAAGRSTIGATDRRLMDGLVIVELALAFLLLVAAGLLVRSYAELQAVDLGFEREGRLTVRIFVPRGEPPEPGRNAAFFEELIRRVEGMPGVRSAAGIRQRPLDGPERHDAIFSVEGQTHDEHLRNPFMTFVHVTPGYFRVMGMPLVAGRDFDDRDDADAPPAVIVSRVLAERYWPGQDAVGRRLKFGAPDSPAPWMTVVGVAGEARYRGLEAVSLNAYFPHRQPGGVLNDLVVHATGDPTALVGAIRREIRAVEPGARAVDVATVGQLVDATLARPRFHTTLLGLFAVLALILATVGTYGVISFAVTRRRREFAIRIAVGAAGRDLLGDVLRRTTVLTLISVGIGAAGAVAASRALKGMLFGVSRVDPALYAGIALALLATGIVAALVPARRAARSDPMASLRND